MRRIRQPFSLLGAAVLVLSSASASSASAARGQFAEALGPQFLPGDDALAAAASDQQMPAVARGGNVLLAVWADKRAYPSGVLFGEYETASDIYGMRLDANGVPIDAEPFVVTQEPGTQDNPKVVWNGTQWLVLFESYDINGTGYYYQKSLEAVRVAPTGEVIDAAPIKIRNVAPVGVAWAAASDGIGWVVAFESGDSNSALKLLRIDAAGVVAQPPKTIVESTYYLRFNLRLAYANGVFLFAWTEFYDTLALRFDTELNLLAAPTPLVSGQLSALTSSASQFYVVWLESDPTGAATVMGSRVSTAGVRLDGAGVNISGANEPQPYTTNDVAWDGVNFKVSWGWNDAVSIARVSAAGQVLDPGGVSVAGPSTGPSAATANGGLQLVWSEYRGNEQDVLTANVPPSNTAAPNRDLSVGAPMQIRADVASGAAGSMFVFRSDVSGTRRVMAQPLDAAGTPSTPEPILLDSGPNPAGLGAPAVAWNGSVYLATWANGGGIVGQRLNPNGTLVDPAPFAVMAGFGPNDVAALGDVFLVVGRRYGSNVEYINAVAARVRGSDGAVLDPAGILIGSSYVISTAVTRTGNRWLAAWRANFTHDNPHGYTRAAFVDAGGASPGEFNVYGSSSGGGNGILFEIAAASDGSSVLVLQPAPVSGLETDLIGVFVNADGSLRPPVDLTPWIGKQYNPRVAWNGSHYVVAYTDQKNRFAAWALDQLDARGDLFGMRIRPDGTIVDPRGFAFSISPAAEASANVAAAGGVTILAGSIMRNPPFDAYRVGYQLFGVGGNQWPVAVAGADSRGGDAPLTVSFTSAGSTDPDGVLTAYAWDFGDGAVSGLPDAVNTFTVPGNYVVTLTVTDDQGVESVNTVPVAVTAPNQTPVAVAYARPAAGAAPLEAVLFGEQSYDIDGAVGNYEWTFSDGGTYWGSTAYHTFEQLGTNTATLTVYDDRGGTGTTVVVVIVFPPGEVPPLAPSSLTYWTLTATSADLHWTDNSSNELGFVVERCVGAAAFCNANPTSFVPLPPTAPGVTSLDDTGLLPGTTYSWRVRAFNAVGSSGYSNTLSARTLTAPAAPTNLTATARHRVILAWADNATDETGYRIERCAGAGCTGFAPIAYLEANAFRYVDPDPTAARRTTYRYRVAATGPGGQSPYSNVAAVTMP